MKGLSDPVLGVAKLPAARGCTRRRAFVLVALIAGWGWATVGEPATGYRVIMHPGESAEGLSRDDLSRLFMKKSTKWSDGTPVVPVDQPLSSRVREVFSRDVHGKGAAAVDAYWQKQVFSGRGVPPVTMGSDAEVVAFVRSTPGAIGYVAAGADTSGVMVVSID